jgi:hypothetical protein
MSISIATMGMFQECCGVAQGGGGAPPYRPYADTPTTPVVFVRNVEMNTINSPEDKLKKISIKLKDEE